MASWKSERPHGRLFMKLELRIEAVPQSDGHSDRIADALDQLDLDESLAAVARRIEEAVPEVRVEVTL